MKNAPLGFRTDQVLRLRVRPSGATTIGPAGTGVQSIGTRLGAPQSKAL